MTQPNNLRDAIEILEASAADIRANKYTPEQLALDLMLNRLYGSAAVLTALIDKKAEIADYALTASMLVDFADDLRLIYPGGQNK